MAEATASPQNPRAVLHLSPFLQEGLLPGRQVRAQRLAVTVGPPPLPPASRDLAVLMGEGWQCRGPLTQDQGGKKQTPPHPQPAVEG